MTRAVALLGVVGLVAGCPYVSRAELEDQLELRDDDGDGVSVADGDCNDLDATVYPGADEVPYDNVDNDCEGGDEVDVDGDGHDGCLVENGLCVEGDAPDCDDDDATRYPGAVDQPYDGIDHDCRGDHDYDRDGDGFVSADFDDAEIDAYESESGQRAERGDCLDTNVTVYPGAAGDEPYDGVDTDCDGAHDFDADGDGFVAPANETPAARIALESYLEDRGEAIPSDDELDCDDADDAVNPGADEVWYDGVDGNCDGADDYDQDGDGFVLDEDCSDDPAVDPDAALRSPAIVETLGNGVDDDCGGDGDVAPWGDGDLGWTGARSLQVVWVEAAERFVVGTLVDLYDPVAADPIGPGLVLLNFDATGGPAPDPSRILFQPQPSGELDAGLSLRASTASDVEVGFVTALDSTSSTRQWIYELRDVGASQSLDSIASLAGSGDARTMHTSDLGERFGWACGDGALLAVDRGDALAVPPVSASVAVVELGEEPRTCFAESTAGQGTVCTDSGCQRYENLDGLVGPVSGREGDAFEEARRTSGVLTFVEDGALIVEGADVADDGSVYAHAHVVRDDDFVVLVAETDAGLSLSYGTNGEALDVVPLDTSSFAGSVVEVTTALGGGRVWVVVRTDADEVRWASWQR